MFWGCCSRLYIQCTWKSNSLGFSSLLIYIDFWYFKRIKGIFKFKIQNQPKFIDSYGGTELTQWSSSSPSTLRCPFYAHSWGSSLPVSAHLCYCALSAPFRIPLLSLHLSMTVLFLFTSLSTHPLLYFDALMLTYISSFYSFSSTCYSAFTFHFHFSGTPSWASIFLLLSF